MVKTNSFGRAKKDRMNFLKFSGIALAAVAVASLVAVVRGTGPAAPSVPTSTETPVVMSDFKKPEVTELKKKLSAEQFAVTQQCGTEPPFRNAYWDNKKPGLYVDVVSGEPLFSSLDKFDSGTGWPSFTRPVTDAEIVEKKDTEFGMVRTEVRSKKADSHLGHVFDDGPGPSQMRYCINSASMSFIPVEKMAGEGYGAYLGPFVKAGLVQPVADALPGATPATAVRETAILAGGCFWGMEEVLRKIPGVLETSVGYTGGTVKNPSYEQICTGRTGHAEGLEVVFDPAKLSYEQLLGYFFRMHDPTTLNQQHNDIGTQYRSAIFFASEAQKQTAERVKAKVNQSGKWKRSVVTEITQAAEFYPAEAYHQDYLIKHPGGYNCHVMRPE